MAAVARHFQDLKPGFVDAVKNQQKKPLKSTRRIQSTAEMTFFEMRYNTSICLK